MSQLLTLVDGRVDPEQLRGKHVIVGTTAPGLLDLRATPFSPIYPGVEIHATLLAAMLEPGNALLRVPYWKQLADYGGLAILGVISLFILPGLSPTILIIALASGVAGLIGAARFFMARRCICRSRDSFCRVYPAHAIAVGTRFPRGVQEEETVH